MSDVGFRIAGAPHHAFIGGRAGLRLAALLALLFGSSITFVLGTLGKESLWMDELFTIAFSEPTGRSPRH